MLSRYPLLASPAATRLIAAAVCAGTLALAGCKTDEQNTRVAGWTLTDPEQRHPILVSQKPTTLNIHVARGASGLSPHGRAELIEFAERYRAGDSGNSRLVIQAPSGSANEVAIVNAVEEARQILSERGFPDTDIAVEAYTDAGREPPIRISYLQYVAEGPECWGWPTNLARNPDNMPMPSLGCATQRNFAAQVANPSDLLGPRSMTPRASERRQDVWSKYLKGEKTATDKTEDEKINTKKSD
jgi:pilus assembly protein CpaD